MCFDTCHVFAAGYALATYEQYAATMLEFDKVVGRQYLYAFHLNDSKGMCAHARDRTLG